MLTSKASDLPGFQKQLLVFHFTEAAVDLPLYWDKQVTTLVSDIVEKAAWYRSSQAP